MRQAASKSSQKDDNFQELPPHCFNKSLQKTCRKILPGRWHSIRRSWWRTSTDWIHAEIETFLKSKMELTLQFSDKKKSKTTKKRLADSKKEGKGFERAIFF